LDGFHGLPVRVVDFVEFRRVLVGRVIGRLDALLVL
jgi:hypothetical protein